MSDILKQIGVVLDYRLFEIGGTTITLATICVAGLIIIVSYLIALALRHAMTRGIERRGVTRKSSVTVIARLTYYAVILIGVGIALDTVGIELSTLFAAGAVFAIGIGFAMQTIAQNFVAGIILMIERSITPGDILAVEGQIVRVVEMGIRSTLARTRDEEELIVPNAILVQSTVKNYTLRDSLYRLRAGVGVTYSSDLKLVFATLQRVAEAQDWRNRQKEPRVLLTEFGNSSVNFDISVWIDDPWEAPILLSKLNDAVWWGLNEAGITIAFPQLDVHFDDPSLIPNSHTAAT